MAASVTLAWDPPDATNVVGYKVYYGPSTGNYTNSVSVGNVTNATIPGLTASTTYYFAASTLDDLGQESVYSTEIFYTMPGMPVNQPPTINTLANRTINESAGPQTVNLSGISAGATNETQTLTVTASSSSTSLIPNPTVTYTSPNSTGSLSFTPVAYAYGTATITVTVNDGGASNNITTRTFTVTVNPVNQAPTLNTLANLTINEGAGAQTVNLSGISSGMTNENQTLTVTASSSNTGVIPNPTVSYTSPNATGSISFTPAPYAFGSATITVTVNDGGSTSNTVSRTFTVTVNPVNQAPTLNTLANLTINEGAGQQTVNLSGISSGATNENQTLTVTASSSNTGVIPNPAVSYTSPNSTGSITFTPVAFAYGSATITVTVNDGGTSSNTVSRTFTVTVNSLNQAPTLNTLANLTINEGAGAQTVNLSGISSGATNENQTLTVTASSSNTGLIPNPTVSYTSPNATGSISFTPVPYAFGSATVTVTVDDGGASSNTVFRTFTVTVNPVNQAPTLNTLANITVNEDTLLQTVSLAGITSGATNENQTLTVTASSSNKSLVPDPLVTYTSPNATGSLGLSTLSGSGSSTITVTVNDGGASNNIVTRTFTVAVNAAPTISTIDDQIVRIGATIPAIAFTVGDTETAASALTVSAESSDTTLVPTANIVLGGSGANRTATITPQAGESGYTDIALTVSDGVATSSTTFQLTIQPKPAAPANLRVVQTTP